MTEYFENALYNMYCIHNMVSNDRKSKDFLGFRLKVAAYLIGDKYNVLDRDKKFLHKKQSTRTRDVQCQPEKYTYGLHQTYMTYSYHIPHQHGMNLQVKYCVVCMKYENLTKTFYECKLCS